jgi:predicted PurR-regulated permease PerM
MLHSLPSESFLGTLWRYFGYLSDAIVITITLQVLVALVNTVLTLPVLILLKLPRIPAFTALIFFSSLVPVVGNLLSGAVLIAASYVYRGVWAVVFFVITTFVLHKIEAYYLNPRLAAQHVKLPSLMLVTSLILHEHLFGIVGLFLSFPVLYVCLNILQDLRSQFSACSAPAPGTPRPVPPVAVAPLPAPAPSTPSAPSKKRRR